MAKSTKGKAIFRMSEINEVSSNDPDVEFFRAFCAEALKRGIKSVHILNWHLAQTLEVIWWKDADPAEPTQPDSAPKAEAAASTPEQEQARKAFRSLKAAACAQRENLP